MRAARRQLVEMLLLVACYWLLCLFSWANDNLFTPPAPDLP